jgi:hypothetical protein
MRALTKAYFLEPKGGGARAQSTPCVLCPLLPIKSTSEWMAWVGSGRPRALLACKSHHRSSWRSANRWCLRQYLVEPLQGSSRESLSRRRERERDKDNFDILLVSSSSQLACMASLTLLCQLFCANTKEGPRLSVMTTCTRVLFEFSSAF